MHETLRGRRIVLAGGSGGLGRATAELLAAEGARLTVSFHANVERAKALGGVANLLQADLTKAADRTRLLDAVPELYGLVVFAGDPSRVKDPAEMQNALEQSNAVNYMGPILLAREAADRMRRGGIAGAIVLFSTMQAVGVFPGSTAYAGAKSALTHATLVLAKECRGPVNIRVNVIAPGVMDAGMARDSIASGKYEHLLRDGVIPRYGRALDVARAVRFFLEPDNYVTGQVLSVDGGATL